MRVRFLVLVVVAGVAGSLLYSQGLPGWFVYVVRHLIYHFGG
jgi:hypothetical protein